jgi:hypothetical protein
MQTLPLQLTQQQQQQETDQLQQPLQTALQAGPSRL